MYIYMFLEISTTPHCSVKAINTQVISDMTHTISFPKIMKGTLFIPYMSASTYIFDIQMFI